MRMLPPSYIQPVLKEWDSLIISTYYDLTGILLTGEPLRQARLNTSKGGLGLRSTEEHSPFAYYSSSIDCASLDDYDPNDLPDFANSGAAWPVHTGAKAAKAAVGAKRPADPPTAP